MGMELALFGQVLVGLALCLPTLLAASVARVPAEAPRRAAPERSAPCGRR